MCTSSLSYIPVDLKLSEGFPPPHHSWAAAFLLNKGSHRRGPRAVGVLGVWSHPRKWWTLDQYLYWRSRCPPPFRASSYLRWPGLKGRCEPIPINALELTQLVSDNERFDPINTVSFHWWGKGLGWASAAATSHNTRVKVINAAHLLIYSRV